MLRMQNEIGDIELPSFEQPTRTIHHNYRHHIRQDTPTPPPNRYTPTSQVQEINRGGRSGFFSKDCEKVCLNIFAGACTAVSMGGYVAAMVVLGTVVCNKFDHTDKIECKSKEPGGCAGPPYTDRGKCRLTVGFVGGVGGLCLLPLTMMALFYCTLIPFYALRYATNKISSALNGATNNRLNSTPDLERNLQQLSHHGQQETQRDAGIMRKEASQVFEV